MKMRIAVGVVLALAVGLFAAESRKRSSAVDELFLVMGIESLFKQTSREMIDGMVASDPALSGSRDIIEKYYAEHLSWALMKDDFAKLYTDEFTDEEMRELTRFYRTPAGKKLLERMPGITAKGGEIVKKRLQRDILDLYIQVMDRAKAKSSGAKQAKQPVVK